jgi:UDP-N-acetylglucosamine transferase subunit ALG13
LKKDYIFVTVGTGPYQFNRLLKILDNISSKIKYKIIAQIGSSSYTPKNYEYFKFSTKEERERLLKNAKIIINHGGAGSSIECLTYKRPTIIFPRQLKYGEHRSDTFIPLAKKLDEKGLVIAAYTEPELLDAIKDAHKFKVVHQKDSDIIKNLDDYLKSL